MTELTWLIIGIGIGAVGYCLTFGANCPPPVRRAEWLQEASRADALANDAHHRQANSYEAGNHAGYARGIRAVLANP